METMISKNTSKNNIEFICYYCNYNTSNKKDYKKHCQTTKHSNYIKDILNGNESPQKSQQHTCFCGKKYKFYSGLFRHKRKCMFNKNLNNSVNINEQLLKIVGQNEEFKQIIIEQQKENHELKNYIINIHKNYIISNSVNIEKLISAFSDTINTITNQKPYLNNLLENNSQKNFIKTISPPTKSYENNKNKKLKFLEINDVKINIELHLKEVPIKLFYIKLLETHGVENGIQIIIINNIKINNKCILYIKEEDAFYVKFVAWEKYNYPYSELSDLLCLIINNYKNLLMEWLISNKICDVLYNNLLKINTLELTTILINKLKTE